MGAASGAAVAEAGAITATTATGTTLRLIQGGATAAGGTAASSGVAVTLTKAAAASVVAGAALTAGMSQAEAARAVRPLIGKRIAVVLDVTNSGGLAAITKPGQPITAADGDVYYPVVLLRSDER